MIAGETGSFELEARLKEPESASEKPLLWDRKSATPLVIWIASPDNSGIAFIDKLHPDRRKRLIKPTRQRAQWWPDRPGWVTASDSLIRFGIEDASQKDSEDRHRVRDHWPWPFRSG